MRDFFFGSAGVQAPGEPLAKHRAPWPAQNLGGTAVVRAVCLVAILGLPLVGSVTPAIAAGTMPRSVHVALIPGPGPVPAVGLNGADGIMPTTQYVSGRSSESFANFSFTNVSLNDITPARLSQFDTVALIEVNTNDLTSPAKSALAQFVANGGKLLIHDADETHLNDYSWILPGSQSTEVGSGCPNCGLTSGTAQVTADSPLISSNPSDASYVDFSQLRTFTDALGDANLLVSLDPRWFAAVTGTNGRGEPGALVAYTANNGLVIYNGFDTDLISRTPAPPWRCIGSANYTCPAGGPNPSVDWLAQMWYDELNQSWTSSATGPTSDGLPQTTRVRSIGTHIPISQAGLPNPQRCVAKRRIFIRLKKLLRTHPRLVQIDVYVNGIRVGEQRKGRFHNMWLRHLPRKGSYLVEVLATTKGHFHLISEARYHAC